MQKQFTEREYFGQRPKHSQVGTSLCDVSDSHTVHAKGMSLRISYAANVSQPYPMLPAPGNGKHGNTGNNTDFFTTFV